MLPAAPATLFQLVAASFKAYRQIGTKLFGYGACLTILVGLSRILANRAASWQMLAVWVIVEALSLFLTGWMLMVTHALLNPGAAEDRRPMASRVLKGIGKAILCGSVVLVGLVSVGGLGYGGIQLLLPIVKSILVRLGDWDFGLFVKIAKLFLLGLGGVLGVMLWLLGKLYLPEVLFQNRGTWVALRSVLSRLFHWQTIKQALVFVVLGGGILLVFGLILLVAAGIGLLTNQAHDSLWYFAGIPLWLAGGMVCFPAIVITQIMFYHDTLLRFGKVEE